MPSSYGPNDGGRKARAGGIKGVQSLQNLTSYANEELTRVVSERTVCYCSNFDLDAAEWYSQYQLLKRFMEDLQGRLGKLSQFSVTLKRLWSFWPTTNFSSVFLTILCCFLLCLDESWFECLQEAVV